MQRSTLHRVSYQLTGDTFQRSYLTVLDPTQNTTPVVQDLLTGVKTVTLNYLDGNQNWSNQWPPPALPFPESSWTRPVAVEIVLDVQDGGRVRRLGEIAGGVGSHRSAGDSAASP